jgi:hypothetical protein
MMTDKFPRLSLPNWAVNVEILEAIHDHICDVQLAADDSDADIFRDLLIHVERIRASITGEDGAAHSIDV